MIFMKRLYDYTVIIRPDDNDTFVANVPAIPGCATQGDTYEELLQNLAEAIEGCLSVDVEEPSTPKKGRIIEIAV